MQEHEHVKTTANEPKAPEVLPRHPVRPLEGGGAQAEDINIPLLTLFVGFFAVLLLILIVSLQAWFYNADNAEHLAKQVPQGAPGTPLGQALASYHDDLYPEGGIGWNDKYPGAKPHTVHRISIDRAMDLVAREYATAQGSH